MSQPAVAYGTWSSRGAGSSRVKPAITGSVSVGTHHRNIMDTIMDYYGYDDIVVLPMCCLWRLLSRHMSLNPP